MASIIRIKRSSGTNKPASLNWGEMGYVTGIGSYGGVNQYKDRIFVGDDGSNVFSVGGHYYTSMMDHQPGAINGVVNTRNSDGGIVAVLDDNRKVDQWNVDNLRMDGRTLSSTDTDGDVIFATNGTGEFAVSDDTAFSFGSDKDVKFEYDEDGNDELVVSSLTGKQVKFTTPLNVATASYLGKVKVEDNIISTVSGAGDKLFIDPYPDGLSNEGDVIIKGNLQVDGTTTTVNSTQTTVNDPIMMVGDTTSSRTVMVAVQSGVSTVIIDQVSGIAVNDTLLHSSFSASGITTVTAINSGAKMLTFQGTTTAGISTGSQFTVTHATDTNTDRGLSFKYNVGVGTANAKDGFFGFDDSSIAASTAGTGNHGTHADDSRRWTYVPDATISASVVSGTKGFLDIKGLYYQSGNFSSGGVVWFDSEGLQRSTNAPASPVITSKQVLTAITKVVLTMPGNVTLAVGDIIKQASTNAFGIVESAVNAATSVPLVGVEGTFNDSNTLIREGQSGGTASLAAPDSVASTYVNKPHWTSTLDGGTF